MRFLGIEIKKKRKTVGPRPRPSYRAQAEALRTEVGALKARVAFYESAHPELPDLFTQERRRTDGTL